MSGINNNDFNGLKTTVLGDRTKGRVGKRWRGTESVLEKVQLEVELRG